MPWYRVRGRLQLREKEPGGGNGNGNGNGENGNGENGNGGNGNGNGDIPEIPGDLPEPPPGMFEVPTPEHPVMKLDEDLEQTLPPGGVWPRPEGEVHGTFLVLAGIPRRGWRYIVIDPNAIAMPQIPRPEPTPTKK